MYENGRKTMNAAVVKRGEYSSLIDKDFLGRFGVGGGGLLFDAILRKRELTYLIFFKIWLVLIDNNCE